MSHLDRGILGPIHGNIADINGYSYYGKDFIRSRITSKNDARTDSQLAVRSGFRDCSDFLKLIYYSVIAQTFSYLNFQITNWFFFFKKNLGFFHGSGAIDFPNLFISQGDLDIAPDFRITAFFPTPRITIRWTNTWDNVNSFPNDLLNGFVYNETKKEVSLIINAELRQVPALSYFLPSNWVDTDVVKVYGYFITNDESRITNTMFAFWPL